MWDIHSRQKGVASTKGVGAAGRRWGTRGRCDGAPALGVLTCWRNIRDQTLRAEDRLREAEVLVPAGPVPMTQYEKPQWGFKQGVASSAF